MVFRNERVEPNITRFAGHVVGATQHPSGIAMDYVNMHHRDLHLQAAYRAIFAIVGDDEGKRILISSPSVSCTPEVVAALSK